MFLLHLTSYINVLNAYDLRKEMMKLSPVLKFTFQDCYAKTCGNMEERKVKS